MRDPYGLVPPHIKQNYMREEMVDRMARAALPIIEAVHRFDPRCDLKFIGPRADPEEGVVPGRWHLVRRNKPPAADSYMAITTESGGYRDPDFGVLDTLRDRDLWRTGVPTHERKPEVALPDDGRVDELAHDLRAGARLPGDGGLTKKLWGRK